MTAYPICWKPATESREYGWPEAELAALASKFRTTGSAEEPWRFQRRRDVSVGERVFLLRQGRRGHAILGYGKVAALPQTGYEGTRVSFDALLSPRSQTVLATQEELHAIASPKDVWNARASGIQLAESIASRLEALVVGRKPVPDTGKSGSTRVEWSPQELRASVEAYIGMQQAVRSGKAVNKRKVYQDLVARFGRTSKAFEYRMQNISYVLSLLGRSWLPGLVPAKNVGANVAIEIESVLAQLERREPTPWIGQEVQVQNAVAKNQLGPKPAGSRKVKSKMTHTTEFDRDREVKEWVLINAKGKCECCGKFAPFATAMGIPFLEVHHVRQLADNGSDTVENAVALCPNCHRELHLGRNSVKLVDQLYKRIHRLVRE